MILKPASPARIFAGIARTRLHAEPPLSPGAAQQSERDLPQALRPAAVLVPIIDRPGEATVLFTERATNLRSHSGQIAFPGGKIDDVDDGVLGAALRECDEEIGLAADMVEPIGYLDLVLTHTGYRINPVVALVRADFKPRPNPHEVAGTFECPLAFLMDPDNHGIEQRHLVGRPRTVYIMDYGPHRIWGITAGIVRNLFEHVYGA